MPHMNGRNSVLMCVVFALGLATVTERPALSAEPEASADWWRVVYVADYLSVGVGVGLLAGLHFTPPADAGIGPVFDADNWQGILDPAHSNVIGAQVQPESVPAWGLLIGVTAGLTGIMVMEGIPGANGLDRMDAQLLHDSVLGYLEAVSWTLAITEIFKTGFGRLRPDFQDRVRRYHCGNKASPDPACAGFSGQGLDGGAVALDDGQRSFFSGHSSLSFGIATYWSLAIGGRMVWGERADSTSAVLGIIAQVGLLVGAGYVSGSRVGDDRHHVTDVVVGSLVGFAVAHAAYWRHFDADGMPRTRLNDGKATADLMPASQGLGLGVGGTF